MLCLSLQLCCKGLVPRRKEQVQPKSKDPTFVPSILQKLERSKPHQPTRSPSSCSQRVEKRHEEYIIQAGFCPKCFILVPRMRECYSARFSERKPPTLPPQPPPVPPPPRKDYSSTFCVDDESAPSPTILELLSTTERQLNLGDLLNLRE